MSRIEARKNINTKKKEESMMGSFKTGLTAMGKAMLCLAMALAFLFLPAAAVFAET